MGFVSMVNSIINHTTLFRDAASDYDDDSKSTLIKSRSSSSSPTTHIKNIPSSPIKPLLLVSLLALLSSVSSFPSGAPESACKDLKPGHGGEPTSGPAPFELSQDKLQVEAGDQIKGNNRFLNEIPHLSCQPAS